MSDRLYGFPELAALLNKPVKTLRNMRTRGELPPAVIVGGSVRWRPGDIDRWIAERTEGADTGPDLDAVADLVRTGGRRQRRIQHRAGVVTSGNTPAA